ncbi:hypothetical protein DFH09DRAFT_1102108 [Mycena vulgaris]|nr:hypothetical protein DFH09DRAFT_1102108 [Mycena vulgaris]
MPPYFHPYPHFPPPPYLNPPLYPPGMMPLETLHPHFPPPGQAWSLPYPGVANYIPSPPPPQLVGPGNRLTPPDSSNVLGIEGTLRSNRRCRTEIQPGYLKPEMEAPHDHPLVEIFKASVSRLSVVLAGFHATHPVVKSYNQYFTSKPSTARDTECGLWLSSLRLCPTPELKALMEAPLRELLAREVLGVQPLERRRRVFSVGSALLQLLAIQQELGGELSLHCDPLRELVGAEIELCKLNATQGLRAMFLVTEPIDLKHRK